MGNGGWGMENGEWGMEDGGWKSGGVTSGQARPNPVQVCRAQIL